MQIVNSEKNLVITGKNAFDIQKTFECGQCFRFDKTEQGYEGVAYGRHLKLCQAPGGDVIISGITQDEFDSIFYDYFDLGRDYEQIDKTLSCDPVLRDIVPFSTGIRILRQQPFETLVSFIISATNNIPRIKKIVASLCENFGEPFYDAGKVYYAFPTPEKLASLSLSDLAVIRAGFRDKYILDCARKVAGGQLSLEAAANTDCESAAKMLMSVNGVGRKVADCTLLFGLGFLNSFPKDVWIKRILLSLYGKDTNEGLDFGGYDGIAQQYLFYYARENQIKDITKKG